jgi:hypothetical protein
MIIEYNMLRNINFIFNKIIALVSFVLSIIVDEHTLGRSILELVFGMRSQPRIAQAAKRMKMIIIWSTLKQLLIRSSTISKS